ncbi:MAG: hypothetical protein AAF939_22765 [Planctomycetota bacterium]
MENSTGERGGLISKPDSCWNPRRWSIFLWALLSVWMLISILGNIPPNIESVGPIPSDADQMMIVAGYPLTYREILVTPDGNSKQSFYWEFLLINLACIGIVISCLVFSVQTLIPRFSLKLLMIAITIVVLLILVGQQIWESKSYYAYITFGHVIFFSPVALALVAFWKRLQDRRSGRGALRA